MKILSVDDHLVVREGLRHVVSALPGTDFFAAATCEEALALFRSIRPDLTILDLQIAGLSGFDLLRRFMAENPAARVLILTMHAQPIYAARALNAGAAGFLSKAASVEELLLAVANTASGKNYLDRQLVAECAFRPGYKVEHPLSTLTLRETEILRLCGEGHSPSKIADKLGVSRKTVANATSSIKFKLCLESASDLVRIARDIVR